MWYALVLCQWCHFDAVFQLVLRWRRRRRTGKRKATSFRSCCRCLARFSRLTSDTPSSVSRQSLHVTVSRNEHAQKSLLILQTSQTFNTMCWCYKYQCFCISTVDDIIAEVLRELVLTYQSECLTLIAPLLITLHSHFQDTSLQRKRDDKASLVTFANNAKISWIKFSWQILNLWRRV